MLTYSIDNPENRKVYEDWDNANVMFFDIKRIPHNLNVDFRFMIDKYGFSLSDSEIDQYYFHYCVWNRFCNSNASLCFIIENLKQLNFPISDVLESANRLFQKNGEWDLYFPFDPEEESKGDFEFGYLLGYRWGVEGYFLKRRTAKKLLGISTIRQNVGDEIITSSLEEKFEISYGKVNFFTLIRNSECVLSRDEAKKKSIFNIDAWTELEKSEARRLLKLISNVTSHFKIDIILSYGSLLGQVRHGGIMSWDDDIDLAVNKTSSPKLTTALETVKELGFDIFHWGEHQIPYFKVWLLHNDNIAGFKYSFPFVDIWFYDDKSNEIVFDDGKKYPKNSFYPFRDTTFEGSNFKMPFSSMLFLDATYPDWKTKIEIYRWSHKFERRYFLPLSTSIIVDDAGRIIY